MTGAYRIAPGVGFHVTHEPEPVGYLAHLATGPIMVLPASALTIVTAALAEEDPVETLADEYPDDADIVRAGATAYLGLLCHERLLAPN